ncbi:MAG TPA: hypothetical protein V6D05_17350, partial [Stenomitos sp.]
LLPAVRAADPATLVVTDGFSCREQIEQGTGREALHLAEVVQLALHQGQVPSKAPAPPRPAIWPWAAAGVLVLGGIAAVGLRRRA